MEMEDIERRRVAPDRTRVSAAHSFPTRVVDAAADTAPTDIDLTGVDPVHWAETRERVAILRAWCANGRHPRREAIAAAERMGTTVSHFYRLVATWKRHRDARSVSGHPARRGDARQSRSVPTEAQAIMGRVIDERGTGARFTDVRAEVMSECAVAGVAPPSSGLIHKAMMRARQAPAGGTTGQVEDVALAVVSCLLPVDAGGVTVNAPELVLAVERPGGIIVNHHLAIDGDVVTGARGLLNGLAAPNGGRIVVAATLAGAVDDDPDGIGRDACPSDGSRSLMRGAHVEMVRRSTLLSTTLGGFIDSIPIRHRSHATRAPGPWRPLSAADAIRAVDLAIAAHNARRRG